LVRRQEAWLNSSWLAYTWPDETFIGRYSVQADAEAAVLKSYDVVEEERNLHPLVVRLVPEVGDTDGLLELLLDKIEYRRIDEHIGLLRFLQNRGIPFKDALDIADAALKRYPE
jgi:hypothetical protein